MAYDDSTPPPAEVEPDTIEGIDVHEHIDDEVHEAHDPYPSTGEVVEPEPFVVPPRSRPVAERI